MPLMRVAICADMEGLSGIDRYQHCFPAWPADYRHGVRMLVGDIRAVAEAVLAAGADEIVLADWHYLGRNIPSSAFPGLPIRRLWQHGRPTVGPEGLGRPDAAVLVGIHAGAGNPEGFLSHTFWKGMSVVLGGAPVSEAVLWGLALGAAAIPVVAVAGDQRATEEAAHLLPGIRAVAVKAGTSRTSAMLRPPEDAREELAEAVGHALAEDVAPLSHPFPTEVTIRYAGAVHAERAARAGVGDRTGERDVSARLGSVHDLMPFATRGFLATSLSGGPVAADRFYPRGEGPVARLGTTCLLAATGWVERREVRTWSREEAALYPPVGPG